MDRLFMLSYMEKNLIGNSSPTKVTCKCGTSYMRSVGIQGANGSDLMPTFQVCPNPQSHRLRAMPDRQWGVRGGCAMQPKLPQ